MVEKLSDNEDEQVSIFMDSIGEGQGASGEEWIAHMEVNGTDISLKLDTGPQEKILPIKDLKKNENTSQENTSESL